MEGKLNELPIGIQAKIHSMCLTHIKNTQEQDDFEFYIPPSATLLQHATDSFDLASTVNDFIESDKIVLLISGESGTGKSFFGQDYVLKKARSYQPGDHIPVYMSLPTLMSAKKNLMNEVLTMNGFNVEDIAHLQKTQRFLLVLDAYDETNLSDNLYVTNKLEKWDVKLIFTCRPSYFPQQDNYKSHFMPFKGNTVRQKAFEEVFMAPFIQHQVKQYISQYIKVKERDISDEIASRGDLSNDWLKATTYLNWINKIPGLSELTGNPFLLRITIDVLPDVVTEFQSLQECEEKFLITQAKLYDKFVEQWFSRQEYKLIGLQEDVGMDFQKKCKDFAIELAKQMSDNNLTVVYYEESSSIDDNNLQSKEIERWARFFSNKLIPRDRNDEEQKQIRINARRACLIKKVGRCQWTFLHPSLRDYFVSLSMFNPNVAVSQSAQLPRLSPQPNVGHKTIGKFFIMSRFNQNEADELLRDEGIKIEFQPGADTQKVVLGQGHFGKFKIARRQDNKRFAGVKKIIGDDSIKQSEQEAQCQRELSHLPNVMPLWDSQRVKNKNGQDVLLEFMPLAGFGNGLRLLGLLKFINDKDLKNKFLIHILKSLVTGLKGMHNRRIVHLDMKLENFVIDCRGEIFIIDFGCAYREYGNIDQIILKSGTGDSSYFSPDRLAFYRKKLLKKLNTLCTELADSFDGQKADIWALGLIILQLLLEKCDVFYGSNSSITWKLEQWDSIELNRSLHQISGWEIANDNTLLGLIKKLLSIDPNKRPSTVEILHHPIFSDPKLQLTQGELDVLMKQFIEWKNNPPLVQEDNTNESSDEEAGYTNTALVYSYAGISSNNVLYPKSNQIVNTEDEDILSKEEDTSTPMSSLK